MYGRVDGAVRGRSKIESCLKDIGRVEGLRETF
jgi:hypothetical protein